jgi:steroid delta-isomerase-like uncharacterized protein
MTTETSQQSPVDAAHELADRYLHTYNEHDLDGIAECLAEEAVYHVAGQPEPLRGRAAVLDWVRSSFTAFSDFLVDERDRWVAPDGSTVATRILLTGTFDGRFEPPGFHPTGERLEISGMDRIELRDGKIARAEIYFDTLAFGQKIGAAPPTGSVADRLGVLMQRRYARRKRRKTRA